MRSFLHWWGLRSFYVFYFFIYPRVYVHVIACEYCVKSMTLKEACRESLKILKQVMEEKLNSTNVEVSYGSWPWPFCYNHLPFFPFLRIVSLLLLCIRWLSSPKRRTITHAVRRSLMTSSRRCNNNNATTRCLRIGWLLNNIGFRFCWLLGLISMYIYWQRIFITVILDLYVLCRKKTNVLTLVV